MYYSYTVKMFYTNHEIIFNIIYNTKQNLISILDTTYSLKNTF